VRDVVYRMISKRLLTRITVLGVSSETLRGDWQDGVGSAGSGHDEVIDVEGVE
jgi:hypothetical protein